MQLVLRLCVIALIGLATVGCAPDAPSPTPTAEGPVGPTPDELDAIRFRSSAGLRADLDYVRAVAANPVASSREFGVPLLPAELTELNARAANTDAIIGAIQSYTDAHAADFAGLYLDQQNGGAVTTLWAASLETHAAAIRALVKPGSRIAFLPATFSLVDLQALQDRIAADVDWMRPAGIQMMSVGVDQKANRVDLDVSSANPASPAAILAHYAAPEGMLTVESDGTGAALIPDGTVRGRVLDSLGKPPGNELAFELQLAWRSDGSGDCGSDGVGHGVAPDGGFELPCQAGGHTIAVQISAGDDGWRTIGSGHVVAIAGATVHLEIRLDDRWSSLAP